VGLERQIVIGKHSGTNALKAKFIEYEIDLTDEQAKDLLALVRATAIELKRPLFDKELAALYENYMKGREK
jgi:homocitrate synthase NifV